MDDLLIVRMSDRSNDRYAKRPRSAPLGANLGIVLGTAAAFLFLAKKETLGVVDPADAGEFTMITYVFAIAVFVALAGLFGRFLKPNRRRHRAKYRKAHYSGFPIESEEKDSEDESSAQPSS